ncbi:hypothetical protein DRO54_11070, partial [Candidatus Bathyarchaeota archaeon]
IKIPTSKGKYDPEKNLVSPKIPSITTMKSPKSKYKERKYRISEPLHIREIATNSQPIASAIKLIAHNSHNFIPHKLFFEYLIAAIKPYR